MSRIELSVSGVSKVFSRRVVFREMTFTLRMGESLAITGRNGSGKSTLVKIMCGLLGPTAGTVEYRLDGKPVPLDRARDKIGFVSPYLQLYDEFSGWENLELLSAIRSNRIPLGDRTKEMLQRVGLWDRRHDYVRTYSSGMKQRLKYAFALVHTPPILVLDEPTSNLDAQGIELVESIVGDQRGEGILIVATNDPHEASWCGRRIHLGD